MFFLELFPRELASAFWFIGDPGPVRSTLARDRDGYSCVYTLALASFCMSSFSDGLNNSGRQVFDFAAN